MFKFKNHLSHKADILDKKLITFKEFKKEFGRYITWRTYDCYWALDTIQNMCDIVISPVKDKTRNVNGDYNCLPIVTIVSEYLFNILEDMELYMDERQLRKLYHRLIPKDLRQAFK